MKVAMEEKELLYLRKKILILKSSSLLEIYIFLLSIQSWHGQNAISTKTNTTCHFCYRLTQEIQKKLFY